MHNQAPIQRRKSKRIYVGNVPIGDGAHRRSVNDQYAHH